VRMSEKDPNVIIESLQWAYEMLYARDEMNAKVHCAPIRLSPITERLKIALDLANQIIDELSKEK